LRRRDLLKRNMGEADGAEEVVVGYSVPQIVYVPMKFEFYSKNKVVNKRELHVAMCEGLYEVRVLIIFVSFP